MSQIMSSNVKVLILAQTQPRVRSFEQELEYDKDVIAYVRSSNHMDSLRSDLEHLTRIDFLNLQNPKVRFSPNFKVSFSFAFGKI